MSKRVGVYPGTFDPITHGHYDIIRRALHVVDHLVIGVARNDGKGPLLNTDERVEIVRDEVVECLMFLNSGGVTAKTIYVPLPPAILKGVGIVDDILLKIGPNVFALGRRLALKSL